jgi:hypothetical protein
MATKPSALIDTRVICCGDNLDQLLKEGREIKPPTVREILDNEIEGRSH